LRRVIARFVLSAIAAALVLVLGYLGYIAIIGSFGPGEMFRPTINFLRSNTENSAQYRHPPGEWLRHGVRIWPPVLVSLALVIALGRRVFGVDLVARVAQACIGYTAFLWLYRFTVSSSVIETWWAYSALVIVLAPAFGVLMHVLAERWRRP